VVVHEHTKDGRIADFFQLEVHSAQVEQCHFSPFSTNLLLTGGSDATIKLCQIPDLATHGTGAKKTADRELSGHYKKVDFVAWNPMASNVVSSASSDNTVKFWDIEAQSEYASFGKDVPAPTSLAWNDHGSLVAVGGKDDAKIHLFDPRNKESVKVIDGFSKKAGGTFYVFADNHDMLIGTGKSSRNARQYALWDLKKMDAPCDLKDVDQASGALYPYYDPDNSILYLAGGGDALITYYELAEGKLHFLSQFQDTKPQKAVGWMPKRAMNVKSCEVARCLRLMGSQTVEDVVVPVSFQVPRKSDLFQKDLYPDTTAPVPGLTAAEWVEGKEGKITKQSLAPGAAEVVAVVAEMSTKKSYAQLEAEVAALIAEVARLKAKADSQ